MARSSSTAAVALLAFLALSLHGCDMDAAKAHLNKLGNATKKGLNKVKEAAKKAGSHAKNATTAAANHVSKAVSGGNKTDTSAKFIEEDFSEDAPEFSLPTFAGGCLVGMVAMGGVAMAVTRFRTRRSVRTAPSTADAEEALVECPE